MAKSIKRPQMQSDSITDDQRLLFNMNTRKIDYYGHKNKIQYELISMNSSDSEDDQFPWESYIKPNSSETASTVKIDYNANVNQIQPIGIQALLAGNRLSNSKILPKLNTLMNDSNSNWKVADGVDPKTKRTRKRFYVSNSHL